MRQSGSPRHGWLSAPAGPGWWQPAVNLLGCIFFGISAIAGYVVPETGSVLDQAAANWNTALGAACFLACALDTLQTAWPRRCRFADGGRYALGGAAAHVADREHAGARALEHQRSAIRAVPVAGEVGVAARLLAGDHEALVVLADEVDQPLRPR